MATSEQVNKWLAYALQQVAAESYLYGVDLANPADVTERLKYGFNDPLHSYIIRWVDEQARRAGVPNQGANTPLLPGANRAPDILARRLFDQYEILDHFSNNQFGFSATLLRHRTSGEYTLSLKSLEYPNWKEGGDWERDGYRGAAGEIGSQGFALGQIAAMEEYYRSLKAGWLAGVGQINVTGYSLGGHLATLFTLMHPADVKETVTFNAPGHGVLHGSTTDAANIAQMIAQFTGLLRDPGALQIAGLRRLTPGLRPGLVATQQAAISRQTHDPGWDPFASEGGAEANRSRAYADVRYHFALSSIRHLWRPASIALKPGTLEGSTPVSDITYNKITQLFGLATHDDGTMTANSQRHSANRVRIFVEDQPNVAGIPFLFGAVGDTHNMALIVDTLSVAELFQTIAPSLSLEEVQGLLAAASNLRGQGLLLVGAGRAEADALENALDALRKLIAESQGSAFTGTQFDHNALGFGNYTLRNQFHENVQQAKDQLAALGGAVTFESLVAPLANDAVVGAVPAPTKDPATLAADARADIGYRYALSALNPFVVKGSALYAAFREGGPRQGELDLFNPLEGTGDLTDRWLVDRAAFLHRKLIVNLNNFNNDRMKWVNRSADADPGGLLAGFADTAFVDRTIGYRIDRHDPNRTATFPAWVVFGSDAPESLEGKLGGDRLYGGNGDDRLLGDAGRDYLEGGRGLDHLDGGAGNDELLGGKDADRLAGGAGFDTYSVRKGDGVDYIVDFAADGFGGDGSGEIIFLGTNLTGQKSFLSLGDGTTIWGDTDYRYELNGEPGGPRGILRIGKPGETDGVVVLGFRDGDLGITLSALPALQKTTLSGTEGNDTLAANAGLQKVLALGGHDRITVATNQSEAWGGLGNDYLTNDAGDQQLYGEAGRDILIASAGADELYGGDDADALQGGADGDYLDGGLGDDLLDGGPDADVLIGGDGRDFLLGGGSLVPAISWTPSDDLQAFGAYVVTGRPTGVQAMSGLLRLDGDAADVLDGGAGEDTLFAGGGDDLVLGGDDADLIDGDEGDDTLHGGAGADHLYGDGTEGAITLTSADGDVPVFVFPQLHGSDTLLGGSGDDLLVGDGGADQLYGGEDDDVLFGDNAFLPVEYHGADTLDGGEGADTLYGDGGDDTLYGGEGDDTLEGDASHVPADRMGSDHLDGGDGADRLTGGGAADALYGGAGDDFLHGDAEDIPVSADGADLLDGEDGNDYLRGYGGDDVLSGGAGDDQLLGDGDGSRAGETGADLLIGGAGNDLMDGGAGDDTYELNAGDGIDRIFDQAGANTIVFGAGISASAISVEQGADGSGSFLVLGYGAGDQVAVTGGFTGGIQLYRFQDGTVLTPEELARRLPRTSYAPVAGTSAGDTLASTGLVESLSGGFGNDSYLFTRASGRDLVTDNGGLDTLRFSAGVLASDVTFRRQSNGDLVLGVRDGGEIRVAGHYRDPALRIERVEFADATVETSTLASLPVAPIEGSAGDDRLEGSAFEDTLIGREGQDRLAGAAGADTYVFRPGDGHDAVADGDPNPAALDRIEMRGFRLEDVVLERSVGGTLTLTSLVSGDSVALPDFYEVAANRIERIEFFADPAATTPDSTLTSAELDALPTVALVGTSGDDALTGSVAADTLYGAGGNDVLNGLAAEDELFGEDGDDILIGGAGDDVLDGGSGIDTYLLESGSHDIVFEAGADASRIRLDARLELGWISWETDGEDLVVRTASGSSSLRLVDQMARLADWSVEDGAGATVALSALAAAGSPLAVEMARRAERFLAGTSPDGSSRAFRSPGRYEYLVDGVTVAYSRQESRSEFDLGPGQSAYSQIEQSFTSHDVLAADYSLGLARTIGKRVEHVQTSAQRSDEALIVSAAESESNGSRRTEDVLATLDLTAPTYNADTESASAVHPIFDATGEVIGFRTETTSFESWLQDTRPLALAVPGPDWTAPFGEIHDGRALLSQETIESTITLAHRIVAGDSANTIHSGGVVPTWVDAGGGNDIVYGASADDAFDRKDVLYGGSGDDRLYGAGSILLGGHGDDLLSGGVGSDWIEVTRFETGVKRVEDRAGLTAEDYALQFAEAHRDEGSGEWVVVAPAPGTAANDYAGLRVHAESTDWSETGWLFKDTLVLGWDRSEVRLARSGDELLVYAPPGSEDPAAGTVAVALEPRVRIALPADDGLFGSGIELVSFADGDTHYIGDLLSEVPQEIAGTAADDVLAGTDSADRIIAGAGDDLLLSHGGNDELLGGSGRNLLDGGAGADFLDATEGAGLLIGGPGEDVLEVGSAPAIVLVNPGDEFDRLVPGTGALTLSFGAAFTASNVYAYRVDEHDLGILAYTASDEWGELQLAAYFDRAPAERPALVVQHIEAAGSTLYDLTGIVADFEAHYQANGWAEVALDAVDPSRVLGFKDGAAWAGGWLATEYAVNGTIESLAPSDVQAVLGGAGFGQAGYYGTPGDDVLTAAGTDDFVEGYGGDDVLVGGAGDDRLAGGFGTDFLQGGEGSDRYDYTRGAGADRIEDFDPSGTDLDSVFLTGIGPDDVTAALDAGYLELAFAGSSDALSIRWDPAAGYAIEEVAFEDGTVWDRAALEARLAPAANTPPAASAADQTVPLGVAVAAAGLFTVADPDGDAITQYEFWDEGAGGGHFAKSGVAQPANQAIAVTAAELADLQYVGGAAIGAERLWVRAYDGKAWGAWASWMMASSPHLTNAAPAVSTADATVLTGTRVAAASLFSVTDADGDAVMQYELWDEGTGGGHFAKSGVPQAAGQAIPVAASDLAAVDYVAASAIGAERVWVRASDGIAWSAWASWTMMSAAHLTNAAPLVTASDRHVGLGEAVAASTLFAATDADGDAIASYELWDDGAGGGHFARGGVPQASGQSIPVTAAELAQVQYVGAALNGTETLWARAYDGLVWSAWSSWRMSSASHATNAAPVALAADSTVGLGQSVAAASLFSVSDADGDAIAQYEFWDDGAGGGHFAKGGVAQASGQAIAVAAAELASVTYTGAASMSAERLWVRAHDGLDWSAWKAWNVQSSSRLGNVAPTVDAADTTILLNEPVAAATLFAANDADGDPIAQYELWDDVAGGGAFFKAGVAQAAGQAIPVAAAELASVQYVGAGATSSEQVWVRASDGLAWSNWKNWTVASSPHLANAAPTIAAGTAGALIGEAVQAAGLFSVNDADGDSMTQYEVWDDVAGGGYFAKSGVAQAAGTAVPVSAADLASLAYVGGAAAGTEQVWARAYDGQAWSGWKNWSMVTLAGMVRGGAGDDSLAGQTGDTVLQGQDGADTIVDTEGSNLFHGGSGDDAMSGGAGSDLFAGGEGDDAIQTGAGANVIAFNAGDGVDTVASAAGAANTLSLGGQIRYGDLSLSKDGDHLVLNAGGADRMVLKDWYAGTGRNNVLTLQVVLNASADFDASASDPLRNRQVQQFDFAGLVQQFDAALAASPGLTSWALTNALLAFHLSGSDDAALGGDLAYQYGSRDAFTGIGLTAALDVLSSASFGAQAQALRPFSGLQEGLVKLD